MKTRFYNILLPKFLRNFDDYLLRNYPVVWRTQALFVLFYGLLGAIFLFVMGFLYPVDAQHLTVSHDLEIIMSYDTYHLWSVLPVVMGLSYWASRQYQLGFPFTKIKDTLLTLVLYALCFYVLFAFTTPAFRLGTIYKTAYHWIDTDDMKQLEASNIYPHGFVLLEEDSIYKEMPADTFFQRRETIFNTIWHVEDTILRHLYTNDTLFWKNWYVTHKVLKETLDDYLVSRSNRANRADRPYLSFLFDMSTVYDPYMSYLSDLSYQSYQSSWSNLSDLSNQPNQSYLSFQWYLSYRSDLTDRTNLSYRLDLSDLLNLSNLSNYEHYKQKHTTYMTAFDKYGFKKSLDSTKVKIIGSSDSLTVYRAALPYSIEHAVYAVKHARLYLAKKIYTRHWTLVLKYDLLLAALFYFIPFISIRHMFGLLASCLLGSILIAFKLPKEISNEIGKNISNGVYLLLPMLSCLILHWALLRKKHTQGLVFAEQALFLGLLCVLVGALFIFWRVKMEFGTGTRSFESFQPPYDLAFYGIQVLGIIGAMLTTYVRTLPKQ